MQSIANGAIDLVYDAVSEEETVKVAVAVLRTGGQLVIDFPDADGSVKDVIEKKKLEVVLALGLMSDQNRGALDELWAVLAQWLEKGLVKVSVFRDHGWRTVVSADHAL